MTLQHQRPSGASRSFGPPPDPLAPYKKALLEQEFKRRGLDPNTLPDDELVAAAESIDRDNPGLFDRTLGRAAGAVGRGALGAGRAVVGSSLPPVDTSRGQLGRDLAGTLQSPAFQSYIPESTVERIPSPLRGTVRNVTSPVGILSAQFSPARTALGVAGSEALSEGSKAAGAGPGVQNALAVAGGFLGAPELPIALAKGAARGTQAVAGATLRGGENLAEQMGRANVGNALLPAAPEAAEFAKKARPRPVTEPTLKSIDDEIARARARQAPPEQMAQLQQMRDDTLEGLMTPEDAGRLKELESEMNSIGSDVQLRQQRGAVARNHQAYPWQIGHTDAELEALARQEGALDMLYQSSDWADSLDSVALKEFKSGAFRSVNRAPGLQGRRGSASELKALDDEWQAIKAKYESPGPEITPERQAAFTETGRVTDVPPLVSDRTAVEGRMAQAPLSPGAASEASRIANVRQAKRPNLTPSVGRGADEIIIDTPEGRWKTTRAEAERRLKDLEGMDNEARYEGGADEGMMQVEEISAIRKALGPSAERDFVQRYRRVEDAVSRAEKPQAAPLTLDETSLMQSDWKALSRARGYTEQEITDFQEWTDLHGGLTDATIGADRSPERIFELLQQRGRTNVTPAAGPPSPAPALGAAPQRAVLPRGLAGAKPAYLNSVPSFESDVDRALYIVAKQGTKSKSHAKYVDWLRMEFGEDADIIGAGRRVVDHVKRNASGLKGETPRIPDSGVVPRAVREFTPSNVDPATYNMPAGPLARKLELAPPMGSRDASSAPVTSIPTGPIPHQPGLIPPRAAGPAFPPPPKGPPTTVGMPGQPGPGQGRPTPINVLNRRARGQAALTPQDRARVADAQRPLQTPDTKLTYRMQPYRVGVQRLRIGRPDLAKRTTTNVVKREAADPVRNLSIEANTWEVREHNAIDGAVNAFRKEFNDAFRWKRDSLKQGADWTSPMVVRRPGAQSLHPRTIYDIVENPSDYRLTPEQQSVLQKGMDIQTRALRDAQAQGVDVLEIADARWHRIVTGGVDVTGMPVPANIPSGIKGALRSRRFDTAESGWQAGERYATDPYQLLVDDLKSKVTAVKWKSVRDDIKGMPGVTQVATRVPPQIVQEVSQAKAAIERATAALGVAGGNRTAKMAALQTAEARYIRAMEALGDARRRLAQPKLDEGILIGGLVAPKPILDSVKKYLTATNSSEIETIADMSRLLQTPMTTLDLSYSYIQGQALFYRNNPAWWKAQAAALSSFAGNPAKYFSKNQALIQEGARMGAIITPSEYTIGAKGLSSLPGKIPVAGSVLRGVNRAFANFVMVGETEMYRAARIAAAKGNKQPLQELMSASTAIRKIMGNEAIEELGLTKRRQVLERIALFAPRFFRSTTGLVAQSFTKGAGGNEARKAMGSLLAGGTAITIGAHYASTGQMPNLTDPERGDYLRFKVGDRYFSAYGPFHSLFVMLGRVGQQTSRGDPQGAAEAARRYMKNKSGPVVQAAEHAARFALEGESETFEGQPIEPNLTGVGRLAGEYLPIGAAEAMPATIKGEPEALAELGGINTIPEPTDNVRDDLATEQYGAGYDELRELDRIKLNQQPEIRDRVVQSALDRPDSYSGKKLIIEAEQYSREDKLLQKFINGGYAKDAAGKARSPAAQRYEFLGDYYDLQTEIRRAKKDNQGRYGVEFKEDRLDTTGLEDAALQEYFDILDKATDKDGDFDSDLYTRLRKAAEARWTETQRKYVTEYRRFKEHPPAVQQIVDFDTSAKTFDASSMAWVKSYYEQKKAERRLDLLDLWERANKSAVQPQTNGVTVSATPVSAR